MSTHAFPAQSPSPSLSLSLSLGRCRYWLTCLFSWLNLEGLPGPIADGLNFFQACLEEKVIVVPGIFFDLNPSRRRDLFDSPCHHFVRFSYGPKLEVLEMGLDGIERVVRK